MQLLNDSSSTDSGAAAQNAAPVAPDTKTKVEALISELKASRTDITSDYTQWLKVGFSLASEFGESGRRYFHDISSLYSGYNQAECDRKYNECLKSDKGRTNISTLFFLAEQQGITLQKPKQAPSLAESPHIVRTTNDKNVALSFVESQGEEKSLPTFDEAIYNGLPEILRRATGTMHIPQEKDLILIGSIVTLSCALLPFRTIYHGRTIYPNMYLFVPGPAGSGKGRLDFCYRLVRPIHIEKRDAWQLAQHKYKQDLEQYRSLPKKDKATATSPVKPPIGLLRIPANSSATSFAEAMADNGNMLMFETEGDTVVNTFKSDYGNYSDNFRKAFAHEEFGYLRRGNDSEEREVTNPRLTVVLSGTPEQVKSLNLHIYATMNTSDQSLFPMDSAFKRRWAMEYIPIDYNNNKASGFTIKVNETEHKWVEFLKQVNYMILNATDSEDKQMGEFFIKSSIDEKEFINKVMFYIWNDVCKDLYSSRRISPLYFMRIDDPKDGERDYFTFADLYPVDKGSLRLLEGFLAYLKKEYREKHPDISSAAQQEDSVTPESN